MIAEPVFVDRSGRRRRLIVAAGVGGTLALLIAVGALLAGFTGSAPAAVPGWPTSGARHGAAKPGPATAASATTRPVHPPVVTSAPARHTAAPSPSPSPSPSPAQRSSASASAAPTVTAPVHGRGHSPSARPSKRN